MAAPLRVVVIDDHRSYAEALSLALSRTEGIAAVRPFVSFHEAMSAMNPETPDVVLLDWQLPDVDGTQAIRSIRSAHPETAVALISGHADAELARISLRAGAAFVLPKEASVGEIVDAIRRSARGERQVAAVGDGPDDDEISLSPREAEVLHLLAAGKDVPQIARELVLSVHTIRGYVKDLRLKFSAHTQLELVAIARRRGLLTT
jgi:DNA-binding NarL/FixJ family response regulator